MITGKRRYRTHTPFWGQQMLVLQVQEEITDHIGGGYFEPKLVWRDAQVQDLVTIEATHRPFPVVEPA